MTSKRLHPVDLVFGPMADERFPAIREAMGEDRSPERFVLVEPALTLLQELRPEAGIGDAAAEFVAFVHASWWWWLEGSVTRELNAAETGALLTPPSAPGAGLASVCYIQVEPRRIWARLDDQDLHEPIDGWFVMPDGPGRLRVTACLGLHPARPGLSVVVAAGEYPTGWQRPDGTATFAPRMDGGAAAGLASVDSRDELLLLAWNVLET